MFSKFKYTPSNYFYNKELNLHLEKGKEIERQVIEEKRRTFESLLTIEDVARLRGRDVLNYQYGCSNELSSTKDVKMRIRRK